MVDTADSKSAEGNLMPVRVRPPLPSINKGLTGFHLEPFLFYKERVHNLCSKLENYGVTSHIFIPYFSPTNFSLLQRCPANAIF